MDGFMHYSSAHWISEFVFDDVSHPVSGSGSESGSGSGDLPSPNHFLFCYAPHGIMGVIRAASGGSTWALCFGSQLFPRWASFGAAFFLPGIREFSLGAGCVDAGRKTLEQLRKSIALVPGGIREMSLTDGSSKSTQLVLKDRVGFVRLAQDKKMQVVGARPLHA